MILVTGATGTIGREVMSQLHEIGCDIRAVSRNPQKTSWPTGVDVIAGDLGDPKIIPALLDGVEKIFFMVTPNVTDHYLIQMAQQYGVQHIVMLSSGSIGSATTEEEIDDAIARFNFDAEQIVRQSGVAWTFLRPSGFMSNTLQWAKSIRSEGIVREPFGDVGIACIDPRDIAAVAVQTLISSGHENKIYPLTGLEKLTLADQVKILSKILDRKLIFEEISEEVARARMMRFMSNAELVESYIWRRKNARMMDVQFSTVKEILGRNPRTFEQWAIDHIHAFHG